MFARWFAIRMLTPAVAIMVITMSARTVKTPIKGRF